MAQPDSREEIADALEVMRSGSPISLYTTTWSGTDFRMFQLSPKHDAIIYSNVGKLGKNGTVTEEKIKISDITKVYIGHQSELFQAYGQKDIEPLCFSIEYTEPNTQEKLVLDLVCCRKSDSMIWTVGLRTLLENPEVKEIPIPVDQEKDINALNMMYRSKWKTAARVGLSGTAAAVTFGTPLFLVGAPWLAYSLWTSKQDSDTAIQAKMEEIKSYLEDIKVLLAEKALKAHPYFEVAQGRFEYIGRCYEDAASITEYVLKSTKKQKYASVIQALAEAQALYWKLHILSVQSAENKGWFEGWFGASEEAKYDLGN